MFSITIKRKIPSAILRTTLGLGRRSNKPMCLHTKPERLVDNPEDALAILRQGNKRFVAGDRISPNQSLERLKSISLGQAPFAAFLSCADSRVPVEILFDQGFGDIFVTRVAGNIVTTEVYIAKINDIISPPFKIYWLRSVPRSSSAARSSVPKYCTCWDTLNAVQWRLPKQVHPFLELSARCITTSSPHATSARTIWTRRWRRMFDCKCVSWRYPQCWGTWFTRVSLRLLEVFTTSRLEWSVRCARSRSDTWVSTFRYLSR